jgi:hypothetical protein
MYPTHSDSPLCTDWMHASCRQRESELLSALEGVVQRCQELEATQTMGPISGGRYKT